MSKEKRAFKDFLKLEKNLLKFGKTGLLIANRRGINDTAFALRGELQTELGRKFTLRQAKFMERSIAVIKAPRANNPRKQVAWVGSRQEALRVQEFGGVDNGKPGSKGPVIPTARSSGEGDVARPRQKKVRGPNQTRNIKNVGRKGKGASRQARNTNAIHHARGRGIKFVYLDLGGQKARGIFKVMGTRKKPKIRLMQAIWRRSVTNKKIPWLEPVVRVRSPVLLRKHYRKHMRRLLRLNLSKGLK